MIYKIYGWFSPHTGIELPDLTYLNIFAISTIYSVFSLASFTSVYFELESKADKADANGYKGVTKTLQYLLTMLFSYIIYLILF